jgi:nucleotide-binding universal stress UspA family protein
MPAKTSTLSNKSEQVFGKIAVAIDGSEHAEKALNLAIKLARIHNSKLFILSVLTLPVLYGEGSSVAMSSSVMQAFFDDALKAVKRLLNKASSKSEHAGVDTATILIDDYASTTQAIVDYVEKEKVDLLVVGSRGLSGFKKLLLGSVSNGVATHANCSVLIVK